jgi:hypothetical protein
MYRDQPVSTTWSRLSTFTSAGAGSGDKPCWQLGVAPIHSIV